MKSETPLPTPKMRGAYLFRMAFLHGFAALVGYTLAWTPLPMPWLIGPMLVATAYRLGGGAVLPPSIWRPTGQVIVAAVVGMSFTTLALTAFLDHLLTSLLVAIGTIASGFAAAAVLVRLGRIDPMIAIIASVPGGPAEMSAIAETNNVAPGPVAFVQTLRIMLLVLSIPAAVVLVSGTTPDPGSTLMPREPDIQGVIFLLALALAGGQVFRLLRITSPAFLGALFASATASVLTMPVDLPPYWLLCVAQMMLGLSLGAMFDSKLFRGMGRFVPAACISTLLLLTLTTGLALAVSRISGIPWATMVLATAPGSVTEMSLTAQLLHENAPLVTAFHLVRIFVIMPLAPLLFGGAARLIQQRRRSGPRNGD